MNDMTPATIGHNQPPLSETLGSRYESHITSIQEYLAAAAKAPAKVEDDKTAQDIADLIKKLQTAENDLTAAFEAEKAPHNLTITQISGFFKTWIDKVVPVKKTLKNINGDYKARKDAEAKKKAEEDAAKKRAEEEKQRREAADAKSTADAARMALEEFKRLEEEAAEAKSSAQSEQELAQAEVARCEAKLAKVKADNSALAAEFARRVVEGNPATDEEKATKRGEAEANLKAAKADLEAARGLLTEAREKAKAAREAAKKAEEEAAEKRRETEKAERDRKFAEEAANRSANQAAKIENKLQAGDVSSGGIRSIHGALQTSQMVWKAEVIDRALLDKDALWSLIHGDAIEVAVRKWMLLQPEDKREMPGARFWQEDVAVVR